MRQLRESLGLTYKQAADLAGMKWRSQWSNIESGQQKGLTVESLEGIARALKVKPADLLVDVVPAPKPRKRGAR